MKKIIILIVMHLFVIQTWAQLPQPPQTALSPNAASLGLFGDIPVSHYTGTPNISIPLYELSIGDYTLPVTLSYHTAGIRPDQRPGWVGLGWSLLVGGTITRQVKDVPDEYNNPNYSSGANLGFYHTHAVLNTNQWNQRSYLRSVAQSSELSLKDTEPDEFSFNFQGYSGKFYINHEGSWTIQCNKPVKVVFDNQFLDVPFSKEGTRANTYGYSPSFSGFTIIAEDGIQYVFGGSTSAIEYSIGFFEQTADEWIATAWHLTKIIFPNKQKIDFTYETGDFTNQMYISVYHDLGTSTESSGGIFNPQPKCSSSSYATIGASYQGKLIAPAYLKEIKTANSTITFQRSESAELGYAQSVYSWQYSQWYMWGSSPFLPILKSDQDGYPDCLNKLKWHKLDKIEVRDFNNNVVKSVTFTYNNTSTQRLILTSVTESGKMPHTFEYNNVQSMPPYLSNKTDHWGFFNNTYAYVDNYNSYYSYRNPNATYIKYGIIAKITYPTGGYTEFDFEPHYYRKQLSLNRWESCNTLPNNEMAGGLRIKRIKSYASTSTKVSELEYFYTSDYLQNKANSTNSSGVLGGQVKYYFTDYIVYAFNDKDVRHKMSAFTSNSVLPSCNNVNGSHIGYSEVIEKREDGAFTRYQFTNFDNGYMDEPADAIIQQSRTPYEPYASKEQDRGLLKLQEDYDATGVKVKSKVITYEKDNTSATNYVRSMSARHRSVCPGVGSSYDEGTSYKIYTYLWRVKSESDTWYKANNTSIARSTTINYNNQKLEREKIQTQSDGSERVTYTRYVGDLITSHRYTSDVSETRYMDGDSKGLAKMFSLNMIGIPVEQVEYTIRNNATTYNAAIYTKYGVFNDIPKPLAQYRFSASEPTSQYQMASFDSIVHPANPVLGPGYVTYSSNKDPRLELEIAYNYYDDYGNLLQYTSRDGVPVSYLWGYNTQYPIAKIVGATKNEVESALLPAQKNQLQLLYTPSDIWQIHDRLNSQLPNAQIYGYSYYPLVGITSEISPEGLLTYYKYDVFGRLLKVLDNEQNILKQYSYHYANQPSGEATEFPEPSNLANLTLTVDSPDKGSVRGAGRYTIGSSVTVTATPNSGYYFDGWYEDGLDNKKVATNAAYTFTIANNRMLQARFVSHYTVTLISGTGGSTTGGGNFIPGTNITIKATPSTGYVFDGWYEGSTMVSSSASYTFTVTSNRSLSARFSQGTCEVFFEISPDEGGTAAGRGFYYPGTVVTLSAKEDKGYQFQGWYIDGVLVSTDYIYNYVVPSVAAVKIVVKFVSDTRTITLYANPGGTVTGGGTFAIGTNVTVLATPNAGYIFDYWDDGKNDIKTNPYTFTVTTNRRLEAIFAQSSTSTCEVYLTASPTAGGTVSGGGYYRSGTSVTVTASENRGYVFQGWYNRGTRVSTSYRYTFTVSKEIDLEARFAVDK